MFCSTSYSQLESILHFHTQRSLNGSQYKIGGRPRGEGVLEYGQYQTKGGGGSKNSVFGRTSFVNGPLYRLAFPFVHHTYGDSSRFCFVVLTGLRFRKVLGLLILF